MTTSSLHEVLVTPNAATVEIPRLNTPGGIGRDVVHLRTVMVPIWVRGHLRSWLFMRLGIYGDHLFCARVEPEGPDALSQRQRSRIQRIRPSTIWNRVMNYGRRAHRREEGTP